MHSINVMGHITIDQLAKGIQGTLTKKEKDNLINDLVEGSTSLAVEVGCQIVESKTGLPTSVCRPVAKQIIKNIRKTVRSNMSR